MLLNPLGTPFSLPSAPVYPRFIHSSRLIKSHLLHGFPPMRSLPRLVAHYTYNLSRDECEYGPRLVFLLSSLPCPTQHWSKTSFQKGLLVDTLSEEKLNLILLSAVGNRGQGVSHMPDNPTEFLGLDRPSRAILRTRQLSPASTPPNSLLCSHASLNDRQRFCEMHCQAISLWCEIRRLQLHSPDGVADHIPRLSDTPCCPGYQAVHHLLY